MGTNQNTLDHIFQQLKNKACLKQKVFRNIKEVFHLLRSEAENVVQKLSDRINEVDKSVTVGLSEINEFEFQLKFSGDMLVFVMQTNVITFSEEYPIMQNDYVKADEKRKYFGNIMVYNFMADSIKYNHGDDPGYLLARILVNHENHFYVEGVRQMDFLFTDIEQNILNAQWLKLIIEKAISTSIDTDLIGTKYPDIKKTVTYEKINKNALIGLGQKIGFQMNYEKGSDV